MPHYYANAQMVPMGLLVEPFPFGYLHVLDAPMGVAVLGDAHRVGRHSSGAVLWKLTIGGGELSGPWVVIDREFRPAP